jgi:hypothetical protein
LTHFNLLVLALKVAAIFLVLSVVQDLPSALVNIEYIEGVVDKRTVVLTIILPAIVKLSVASLFWLFPQLIITSVVPDPAKAEISEVYFSNLSSALIPSIGIYLMGIAVSDLAYFLTLKSEMQRQFSAPLQPTEYAGLVAATIQFMVGSVLIIGSKFLVKISKVLRR